MKIPLEPVSEADFLPCSFGFRPKRSAQHALQVLIDECWRGRRCVVETDIAACLSAIPHKRLMEAVEEHIYDQPFGYEVNPKPWINGPSMFGVLVPGECTCW